jgi:cytochrome c556
VESLETLEPLGGYITGKNPYNFEEPLYSAPTITDTDEPFDVQQTTESVPTNAKHGMASKRDDLWDDLRNFDLRKAVIYSAILNRPYA